MCSLFATHQHFKVEGEDIKYSNKASHDVRYIIEKYDKVYL